MVLTYLFQTVLETSSHISWKSDG